MTTMDVYTNILGIPNTHHMAWAQGHLCMYDTRVTPIVRSDGRWTGPQFEPQKWRAFGQAVNDNVPLRGMKPWDADTHGYFLDTEAISGQAGLPLKYRLLYMSKVLNAVKAVDYKHKYSFYYDPSIPFCGGLSYPWSREQLARASSDIAAATRFHNALDYIVIGSYFGGEWINAFDPIAQWAGICRTFRDGAILCRALMPTKKLLWNTMAYSSSWNLPERQQGETDDDYLFRLTPTKEMMNMLKRAIAPWVNGLFLWDDFQNDTPATKVRQPCLQMVEEFIRA